jgi:peptide/nickel transport system substrate-binding protein
VGRGREKMKGWTMRRTKPLAVIAGAALFALAACGGSGGSSNNNATGGKTFEQRSQDTGKDPNRKAPAAEIPGATSGGTITVYLPSDPGPDDLDPTGGWSVTGNSIQQDLVNRSLTTFARDPKTGSMVLVPDLATDLGTHNADFTQWQFNIRTGVKWEDGSAVTPQQICFGIARSLDSKKFPGGPGTQYSVAYFKDGDTYKGPYTGKDPDGTKWGGCTVSGNTITIQMATPFPDMDYWGSFMAMGPVPIGASSNPPDYGKHPLATGPYKVESFDPTNQLVLVKNDQWDPNTDPARHQYVDKWIFKFNADPDQTDQIMLSNNAQSETAMSTGVESANYTKAQQVLGDRLVQQSGQCTSFLYPVYDKMTDINVRKALAYAYPYQDAWQAGGEVPGVTRVPANSIMPPGMTGKPDYFVDGQQFTYDPDKSKALLKQAGYAPGQYKINMIYYEADPLAVAVQKVLVKGFTEGGFDVVNGGTPVQDSPYNTWLNPDDKLNKSLNLRGVNWCSDWPSGLTMLPPLIGTGQAYNTGGFSEAEVDQQIKAIPSMPLDKQADAWGALDKLTETKYFPIIPTAFRNDLFSFGSKIGNPVGDGEISAPDYKDLYVMQ